MPEIDEVPAIVEEDEEIVPDRPPRITVDTDEDLAEPPKPWMETDRPEAPVVPDIPDAPARPDPPADVIETPEPPAVPSDDFRIIKPPVVEDDNVDDIDIDEDEYQ